MTIVDRIRCHAPWLEPWYNCGSINILRLDARETDFSDESEAGAWTFELQWFGVHFAVQLGRTPPRVPAAEVAEIKERLGETKAARDRDKYWRDIGEVVAGSELDEVTLIVTDGIEVTALAFCEGGDWYLGEKSAPYREPLDFEPEFWLPRNHGENPFRAAFPDQRPSLIEQAGQRKVATEGGSQHA